MDKCNDNAIKTCLLKLFEKIFEKHLTREREREYIMKLLKGFLAYGVKKVLAVGKLNGVKVAKKCVLTVKG